MAERIEIDCSCGRKFKTAVRGRGTTCPGCAVRHYVRQNGTVKGRQQPQEADQDYTDREVWELAQETSEYAAMTVEELSTEFDITPAQVRAAIAREEVRMARS